MPDPTPIQGLLQQTQNLIESKVEEIKAEWDKVSREIVDITGRRWVMRLSIGSFEDVKRATGIDLYTLDQGEPTMQEVLYSDLNRLAGVFFAILQRQHPDVTLDDFLHSMGSATHFDANRAFCAELLDFFQQARRPDLAEQLLTIAAIIEVGAIQSQQEMVNPEMATGLDLAEFFETMTEALKDHIRTGLELQSGSEPVSQE